VSGYLRTLTHSDKIDWIRLSRAQQVGPITFFALIERYGDAAAALGMLPKLASRAGRADPAVPTRDEIAAEIERSEKLGFQILARCETAYPRLLAEIEDAPPVIAAGRNVSLFERRTIAIVGARNASANGRRIAERLARDLAEAGLVVVSGLARGIDTAAHRAALDNGTIAVVAGGADIVYPPENAALQADIAARGCVVTEAPLGTEPIARHFPRRNRIISGLAPGVIVVEAARNSGSLITARMALEQGRDVFAVPGSPLDPRAQGTNNLIRQGAILTETAEDVLQALPGLDARMTRTRETAPADMDAPVTEPAESETAEARRVILEALSPTPVAVDELVRRCQVSLPIVLTVLLELELAGRLERQAGQRVSLLS